MDAGHFQREGLQFLVVGLDQTSAPTSSLGNGNRCRLPLAIPKDNAQVSDDICFGDFLIREGVWREAGACPSGGTTESSKPSQQAPSQFFESPSGVRVQLVGQVAHGAGFSHALGNLVDVVANARL